METLYFLLLAPLVLYTLYFVFIRGKKVDLSGKNIIITGGSTGIGKALAIQLAKAERANVTIIARTQSKLDEAEAEIRKYSLPSQHITSISCNVTDKKAVQDAIDESARRIGEPDVIICCAGLATPGYFIEQDIDIFEYTMKVDYLGCVYATKAAVPYFLKKKRGSIVLVASTVAVCGFIGYSTYAPAKYAIRGFAEVLRNELKPHNISVALVYPADTQTPGFDKENETKPPETVEISAGGKVLSADKVASSIVSGMKRGDYHINTDIMTKLFIMGSNGLTPRQYGLYEIILAPLITVFEIGVMYFFDSVVAKHYKQKASMKKQN